MAVIKEDFLNERKKEEETRKRMIQILLDPTTSETEQWELILRFPGHFRIIKKPSYNLILNYLELICANAQIYRNFLHIVTPNLTKKRFNKNQRLVLNKKIVEVARQCGADYYEVVTYLNASAWNDAEFIDWLIETGYLEGMVSALDIKDLNSIPKKFHNLIGFVDQRFLKS